MVVKASRRIAGQVIAIAVLAFSAPALAQSDDAPSIGNCEALPTESKRELARQDALALPPDWSSFAKASRHWLAVKTEAGTTHCIDLSTVEKPSGFARFSDRFVGLAQALEDATFYVLIDLSGTGATIHTVGPPVFSPDGQSFAALLGDGSRYDSTYVRLGIWGSAAPLSDPFYMGPLSTNYASWRIEKWADDDCVTLSSIYYTSIVLNNYETEGLDRSSFVVGADGEPTPGEGSSWDLRPGTACSF